MRARRSVRRRGQALMEYVMVLGGVITPLTLGFIAIAQMLWIWHSVVDWTRLGARYAVTHCWQPGGANVAAWMRNNTPPIPDQETFRSGSAEILVEYYSRDPDSGQLVEFACDSECSTLCVPDLVKVSVRSYEFRTFMSFLGLPPVQIPDFSTMMPVESAGCDPETGVCNP